MEQTQKGTRRSRPQTTPHVRVPSRVKPLLTKIGRLAHQRGVAAYAVGGCVRDWLLGLPRATDLDVAVEGSAIALARVVADAVGGNLTAHQQFGTATVVTDHRRLDFAMCRLETYAKPAAYPRVSAGTLRQDLARRDFSINAMAMAIGPAQFGRLIDPFHGARDARLKRLRILHERSFIDDPSRLLRGVRFAQRFELRWEAKTLRAARRAIATGAFGRLNRGRLRKELDLMLREPNPRRCMQELATFLEPASS